MRWVFFLLVLFKIANCFSQAKPPEDNTLSIPDSTGIGTPDGKEITGEIGPSGGTIQSEDGMVELVFPAGALKENTSISIQPLTNQTPYGSGNTYEFKPSGIRFEKPVQIIFHYTDEEAEICPPDLMGFGVQDDSGKWDLFDFEEIDSISKTIKAEILHFSRYSKIKQAFLYSAQQKIKVNDTLYLDLVFKSPGNNLLIDQNQIPIWYVNNLQGGTFESGFIHSFGNTSPSFKFAMAQYEAPGRLVKNDYVEIKVDIILKKTEKNKPTFSLQKTFTSRIELFDRYDVKISSRWDNTPGIGTSIWNDTSSFTADIQFKNTLITKIRNSNFILEVYHCPPKCKCTYVNKDACIGPIHIEDIDVETVFKDPDRGEMAQFNIEYKKGVAPIMRFECPRNTGSTPSTIVPIIPARLEFKLKDGIQEIPPVQGFDKTMNYKTTVERAKGVNASKSR